MKGSERTVGVAPRPRRIARLAAVTAWAGVLVAVIGLLPRHGLETPALTAPATWTAWATARPPLLVVFAGLQLLVLAAAWYLLVTTVVGGAARLLRLGRVVRITDLVTVPAVRRVLHTGFGMGLAVAGLSAAADGPTAGLVGRYDLAAFEVQEQPAPPGAQTVDPASTPAGELHAELPAPPGASLGRAETSWTVQPGDHLWGIAARVLVEAWDRTPSPDEIVPYWRQLIDDNRAVLVDPANPDLVFCGQQLALPPPPAAEDR